MTATRCCWQFGLSRERLPDLSSRLAYAGRVPWWGWLLVGAGLLGLVVFAFRGQLRYIVKAARALATDERVPRPLRWALRFVLAIKVLPFPDLGIDEISWTRHGRLHQRRSDDRSPARAPRSSVDDKSNVLGRS